MVKVTIFQAVKVDGKQMFEVREVIEGTSGTTYRLTVDEALCWMRELIANEISFEVRPLDPAPLVGPAVVIDTR